MADFQASTYEALGPHVSSDDMELTSFISFDSRTHGYDDVDISNQHGLTTSSAHKLHQPLDVDHIELAGLSHLQQSESTQYSSVAMDTGHRSALQRMGMYSVVTLAATTIFMLLILSFLTFLWTASHENSFWRLIIVNSWAGGAVTVSSLLLRTAVDLQAGIAVGMLAAIILETGHVLLADSAHVSRLRAGRAVPIDIVVPYLKAIRYNPPRDSNGFLRVFIVLLLVVTTTLLQFTSTMLVSDLSLGVLPGTPQSENLRFDFTYEWDDQRDVWSYPNQIRAARPWQRNPSAFPTFAEFSERINVPEHVDDTGELYRAFLPFQDAASRETISRYSGKALILDARVSCQRPQIQQLHIDYDVFAPYYVGTYSNTADVPGLLGSATSVRRGEADEQLRDGKQWSRVAEAWSSGSVSIDDRPNAAYLIFNGTLAVWPDESKDTARNISSTSGHGAWTDVSYLPLTSYSQDVYMNISVALCYPAIWSARLSVALHSPHNRTEPRTSSVNKTFLSTPDVHLQMGELKHDHEKATLDSRGVLSLAPQDSWVPDPADAAQYDFVGDPQLSVRNSFLAESAYIATMGYVANSSVNGSLVWSLGSDGVRVSDNSPDINLASIFTTSLQVTNDSAATASSTIFTILASMAYYDQFPVFAETARDVSTTYLQPFLFPQSFRGFTAVLAVTFAHYLLVFLIVAAFVAFTRLSTLGDHWQTVSQIISPATEDILKNSSCATDKEVRRGLKAEHRKHEMINLQVFAEDGGRVGLVARKAHRRSSRDTGIE